MAGRELSEACFWDQCRTCIWGGCECLCHRDQSWDLLDGWRDRDAAIGNRDGLICLPPLTDVEATGEDFGCCALDDARGSGHEGPCSFVCSHCNGSGKCPACNGTSDDGSGLDNTCMECGGGSCPRCDDGMVTDD